MHWNLKRIMVLVGALAAALLLTAQTYNTSTGRSYGQAGSVLSGTSGAVSGALTVGTCNTTTVNITGATTGMAVVVSPAGGVSVGTGIEWHGEVTSSGVVTVFECGLAIVTPTSTTFNVRVFP